MPESGSGGPESLYADAELYDRRAMALGDRGEADFYATLAPHPQSKILELGSGTGRLSLPLAAPGHAVTGIDNEPGMLAVARRKAAQAQSTARFLLADLCRFSLGGFAVQARYGAYDRTLFGSQSPRQLLVCSKLSD